jgi:cysteine desulfurase
MGRVVYFDNHATTPVDPRVLEAMLPYFSEKFGNAASRSHPFGWQAEEAVEKARSQIAAAINAKPKEIVFTSGATESDNLALAGVAEFHRDRGDHIVTVSTEHKAVLDTCKALQRSGKAEVTVVPVDRHGMVDPEDVRRATTERTILISVMLANNEVGNIQPIEEVGKFAKERGILFHTDAAQALGKIPIDVEAMGIDLMSMTAHKLYGPKGCGALYVRSRGPRVRLAPILHGGGHERGMRSGTLNVPGAVGFGMACEIAGADLEAEHGRILSLRERLQSGIFDQLDGVFLNGHPSRRLAGNLNVSFAHVDGESLLLGLGEVAVSSGSACTSATLEASYVLRAMGVPEELAHSSLRFGMGRFNTEEEVDYVVSRVVEEVRRLRAMSPSYAISKRKHDGSAA